MVNSPLQIVKMHGSLVTRKISTVYHKTHWFSDEDAWKMYRLFAFGEGIGWTLLISTIIYRRFDMPLDDIMVSIAGTVHGGLFALYLVFVVLTARSMMWGFWRISGALLAGMPPYTSLIYEKIIARHRKMNPTYIEPPKGYDE